MRTPLAQELGSHQVDVAVVAGTGAELAVPEHLERLWEEAFLPVQACFTRAASDLE